VHTFQDRFGNITKCELSLGENHGKGAFTFLAVLFVRYQDPLEPPTILEFQIGEMSSMTDLVELLRQMTRKLEISLLKLSPKGQDDTLKLQYKDIAEDKEVTVLLKTSLELNLMGDLNFFFMMMGQAEYCSSWSVYCKLKQLE
jgi:hypothetical protein